MLGRHVKKGDFDHLDEALDAASKYTAFQIYTHGPHNRKKNNINEVEIVRATRGKPLFVHSTYLSSPWKGNAAAIAHIRDQVATCAAIDAAGLVLHLPKDHHSVVVQQMIVLDRIPQVASGKVKLILEMTSVKASPNTYETPEKLNALITALNTAGVRNYGICVDTSHIWAAGVNVSKYEPTKRWFAAVLPHIALIHLNGTEIDLGGGKDTHIIPFTAKDKIWHNISYAQIGLRSCIENAKVKYIHVIMEINR